MDTLKTSFGKKKVNQNEKTFLVQNIFSNVAKNYDLMNDIMSLGAHRLWKKELIDFMNIQPDDRIVDIGSGTGDLINLISKRYSFKEIYSVDLNQEMLNIGKKRFNKENIKFIKANAELLPFDRYLEESIDIFPNQNDFLFNIKKIGFNEASYMNFFNGIVAVHRGFKI